MSRKVYDACVSTGLKKDGQGKFWKTVGAVFQDEKGQMSMKLDTIPLAKLDKDGFPVIWVSFFEPRQKETTGSGAIPQQQPQPQPSNSAPYQTVGQTQPQQNLGMDTGMQVDPNQPF